MKNITPILLLQFLILVATSNVLSAQEPADIFPELWKLDQQHNGLSVTGRGPDDKWLDENADIRLDEQGVSLNPANDGAPRPLLVLHNDGKLSGRTWKTVRALFDNYNASEKLTEDELGSNPTEDAELAAFLDAVMATDVMQRALVYINAQKLYSGKTDLKKDSFRALLKHQWFELYTNHYSDPEPYNSGFEHVFIGDHNGQKIGGHHFWWKFYFDQQAGTGDSIGHKYMGPDGQFFPQIATFRMKWQPESGVTLTNPQQKGFFVGCSPELMLAYGTIGLLTLNKDGRSPVTSLQGGRFELTIYPSTLPGRGDPETRRGDQIKSSFPGLRTVSRHGPRKIVNVAAALAMKNGERVQVQGVIIAAHNNEFGLRLASSAQPADAAKFLAVKLPKSFRADFNPQANPKSVGRKVVVFGTRGDYTNVAGIINVSHVDFVESF